MIEKKRRKHEKIVLIANIKLDESLIFQGFSQAMYKDNMMV